MVWSEDSREVHGVDVSQRYRDLYAAYEHTLVAQGRHTTVTFVMYDSAAHEGRSDARVAANVDVFCGAEQMGGGRTAGPRQDMNDALRFLLEKGKSYTFRFENARVALPFVPAIPCATAAAILRDVPVGEKKRV